MQLKDLPVKNYSEFLNADDIRIKGTRIGIETILYPYIYRQQTAEQIAQTYPALSLEQLYATIRYYLHNQAEVNQYPIRWLDYCLKAEQEQDKNPPPSVVRLLKVKEEQKSFFYGNFRKQLSYQRLKIVAILLCAIAPSLILPKKDPVPPFLRGVRGGSPACVLNLQ